jgi:hypothetical protein
MCRDVVTSVSYSLPFISFKYVHCFYIIVGIKHGYEQQSVIRNTSFPRSLVREKLGGSIWRLAAGPGSSSRPAIFHLLNSFESTFMHSPTAY